MMCRVNQLRYQSRPLLWLLLVSLIVSPVFVTSHLHHHHTDASEHVVTLLPGISASSIQGMLLQYHSGIDRHDTGHHEGEASFCQLCTAWVHWLVETDHGRVGYQWFSTTTETDTGFYLPFFTRWEWPRAPPFPVICC